MLFLFTHCLVQFFFFFVSISVELTQIGLAGEILNVYIIVKQYARILRWLLSCLVGAKINQMTISNTVEYRRVGESRRYERERERHKR